jgi:AbrB family looped-hinge helix DNA binding protein
MAYQTTLTKKGQITIPKGIREALKLREGKRLEVEMEKRSKRIILKPAVDILDLAGKFKTKKKINPVKARELMEKYYGHYEKDRR